MWQLKCICFNSFHIYGQEISFYSILVLFLDVLALTTFEQHFIIHKHLPCSCQGQFFYMAVSCSFTYILLALPVLLS